MEQVRVAVIGLGLIGGSLAHAWRDVFSVTAFDVDDATRRAATKDDVDVRTNLADAVADAEIVVVAVPVDATIDAVRAIEPLVEAHTLVTDTASVKQRIVAAAGGVAVRFVGGHPMAGRELSGYDAATESLFAGARWALCVEPDTPVNDVLAITIIVLATGAGVVPVTAAEHDAAVAVVSHLPHVTAAALAARACADADADLRLGLAAGSFRDGTRVARAPSELWSEVLRANAGPIGAVLREEAAVLQRVADLADAGDAAALARFFAAGAAARTRFDARTGVPVEIRLPADDDGARAALLELGRRGGYITSVEPDRMVHARVARQAT
jgi:prephenate dehydrogenase